MRKGGVNRKSKSLNSSSASERLYTTPWRCVPGCPGLPNLASACRVLCQLSFPKDASLRAGNEGVAKPSRAYRSPAKRKRSPLLVRGGREGRGLPLPLSLTNFTPRLSYYYYYYVQYKQSLFPWSRIRIFGLRRARGFPPPRKRSTVRRGRSASEPVRSSSSRNEWRSSLILSRGETNNLALDFAGDKKWRRARAKRDAMREGCRFSKPK